MYEWLMVSFLTALRLYLKENGRTIDSTRDRGLPRDEAMPAKHFKTVAGSKR